MEREKKISERWWLDQVEALKEGREETREGSDLCRFDKTQTLKRWSQQKEPPQKEEVLVVREEDKELFSEAGSLEIAGKRNRRCELSSQNLEMDLLYALNPPFLVLDS